MVGSLPASVAARGLRCASTRWRATSRALPRRPSRASRSRLAAPHLTEAWYCCAEPGSAELRWAAEPLDSCEARPSARDDDRLSDPLVRGSGARARRHAGTWRATGAISSRIPGPITRFRSGFIDEPQRRRRSDRGLRGGSVPMRFLPSATGPTVLAAHLNAALGLPGQSTGGRRPQQEQAAGARRRSAAPVCRRRSSRRSRCCDDPGAACSGDARIQRCSSRWRSPAAAASCASMTPASSSRHSSGCGRCMHVAGHPRRARRGARRGAHRIVHRRARSTRSKGC